MRGIALPLPENKLCTVCQFYYRWAISRRATAVSIKYAECAVHTTDNTIHISQVKIAYSLECK